MFFSNPLKPLKTLTKPTIIHFYQQITTFIHKFHNFFAKPLVLLGYLIYIRPDNNIV